MTRHPTLWMVRAGRGGYAISDFRSHNLVAIGWPEIGQNLGEVDDVKLRQLFGEHYPGERPSRLNVWMGMVKRFVHDIQIGDEVLTYSPEERLYFLGTIESSVEWRDTEWGDDDLARFRRVTWRLQVPRDALSAGTRRSLGSIATLFKVPDAAAGELRTKAVALGGGVVPLPPSSSDKTGSPRGTNGSEEGDLRADVVETAEQFIEDRLAKLDWDAMQHLVAGVLRAMGYQTQVSSGGSDRGSDIFASPDGLGLEEPRVFVEVKHRQDTSISAEDIRAFLGGRRPGDRCLYVSTGGFTKDARYEAERSNVPLRLINMAELRALVVQFYEKMDSDTRALLPLQRLYWPID